MHSPVHISYYAVSSCHLHQTVHHWCNDQDMYTYILYRLSWQFSSLGGGSLQVEMTLNYSSQVLSDFHSTLHIYFRFSPHLFVHDVVQWVRLVGRGCECFRSSGKIRSLLYRSTSRLLLPSSLCFTVAAADAGLALQLYIPSIAIARWEQTRIDSIQTTTCVRVGRYALQSPACFPCLIYVCSP